LFKYLCLIFFIFFTFLNSKDLEKVSLQLNWKYQFEFAGFIVAKEKGYYKEAGLDVEIREFNSNINVLNQIKSKKATFGLYDLSLLNLKDEEAPVKLVANYFKRSALVFVAKQDVLTPADLKDKLIMADKEQIQSSTLSTLLKKFNIKKDDFSFKQHTFNPNDFINGKVDVMSAYVSNELYDIRKSKKPFTIIDPLSYGIYGSGLNVFTTKEYTSKNPIEVKKFVEASNRGWLYALENKEEIVDLIYDKYSKQKTKEALLFEAKQTEKLIIPELYKIGEINKDLMQKNIHDFVEQGLLSKKFDIDELIFEYKNDKEYKLNFTNEEKTYIYNNRKINMCIDPDWMPYEKIQKNGQYIGMTSDFIPLISERIGIPIKLVLTKSWAESIEFAKQRKCDIFSLAMPTESRLKYMNFTEPYVSFPLVIATKIDRLFINNPESLIEKEKIGIVKGYAIGEILKKRYPKNMIVDVANVDAGMKLVERGEIFGFLDALPTVGYLLQHKYIGELKIAGKFNEKLELGIGVRNDDKILFNLFQKAIASISELKKQEVLNKYISIKVETAGFDYKLFYQILGIIFLIFLFGFYRHRQILKYNKTLEAQSKELQFTKEKLQNSIKNTEVLLDSVIEGILVFENRICIDVNDVAVNMFGFKNKEEIIGAHIKDLVTIESLKIIQEKSKTSDTYELKAKKKNGEIFSIISKGTNAVINSRKVRISGIVDITDTKDKDKILFQQSKMASMGEMLENIAHQWRQPLSVISSISTSLQIQKELGVTNSDDEMDDLKKINTTSQHLSQTIEDFRDFFKPDKEIHSFYILDVVKKNVLLLEAIFKSHGIKVVFQKIDNEYLETYENELAQALVNIFTNAKDAMEKISTDKYIFVNIIKENNYVNISIKDNAGGIDTEIISNIFEPYFTTKHKSQGTGIGLYMTHQIIEKHMNGMILVRNVNYEYENKKLEGAEFIIKLPL